VGVDLDSFVVGGAHEPAVPAPTNSDERQRYFREEVDRAVEEFEAAITIGDEPKILV